LALLGAGDKVLVLVLVRRPGSRLHRGVLGAASLLGLLGGESAAASALYQRLCLPCHGAAGDGRGPAAALLPVAPRDFTRGEYKWRSTATGQPALAEDLRRVISRGVPGAMPAFVLAPAQLDALVAEVQGFAARRPGPAPRPVIVPAGTPDLARGRRLYQRMGCPRCHQSGDAGPGFGAVEEIARTLRTGMNGTAMPAYEGLGADDLWSLAAYASAERVGRPATRTPADPGARPAATPPDPLFAGVSSQGPVPSGLAPAERTLSALQCARCHAAEYRGWRDSRHALAFSAGPDALISASTPASAAPCRGCHTPTAEQAAEGVTCASCHLRGWRKLGPRSRVTALPDPVLAIVTEPRFQRADFCLPCHQAAPFLDTYREWLLGPYMPRGFVCQHCHMPAGDHSFRGAHDVDAVRQGVTLQAAVTDGALLVTLANVGCGHHFPTTGTPEARLEVQFDQAPALVERIAKGPPDTRIASGGARSYRFALPAQARRALVTLRFLPDAFYVAVYRRDLATRTLRPDARTKLEEALRRAESSPFLVHQREVALP